MKTSIFDMTFVLPPMVEMTEVVQEKNTFYHAKKASHQTQAFQVASTGAEQHESRG